MSCRILPNLTLTYILYLVSLLFAPPILHPTNHFLDREVFDILVSITCISGLEELSTKRGRGHTAGREQLVCTRSVLGGNTDCAAARALCGGGVVCACVHVCVHARSHAQLGLV